MEKILGEYRRQLGDFEVVDIDEDRVAALRRELDVDVPVDLHWTWTYASEVEELRALYERGKKGQWNAEADIDWSIPFPRDEWFLPREGMAVGIFDIIQKGSTNSLLSDVIRRVKQDEARHAAFGILTMRRTVREATPDELVEMEDFSFGLLEALNANQQLDMLHDLCPKYGLDADNVVAMLLAQPEWARFNSDVFMHTVVPNLARLGLITERTESRYRACGILWGDRFGSSTDADVQSSLASS